MGSFFALSGGPEAREPITGWPPGTMLNYSSAAELGQSASQTQLGWYEGGGFVLDFPLSLTAVEVRQIFRHLRVQRWTDLGTRAVFFDFALYNSAQRFFLGVRLNFEFLPTGKIKTSDSFRVMRMGVLAPAEWLALVLDAALYLIVLFYIAQDCKKIWDGEWRYWSNPWHYLNWTMYVLFGVSGAFKVLYWMWSLEYINGEMGRDEESAVLDFETLGWYYSQVWNWTSFNCIFVWFKAFSFFKYFNKRIADLSYAVLTVPTSLPVPCPACRPGLSWHSVRGGRARRHYETSCWCCFSRPQHLLFRFTWRLGSISARTGPWFHAAYPRMTRLPDRPRDMAPDRGGPLRSSRPCSSYLSSSPRARCRTATLSTSTPTSDSRSSWCSRSSWRFCS